MSNLWLPGFNPEDDLFGSVTIEPVSAPVVDEVLPVLDLATTSPEEVMPTVDPLDAQADSIEEPVAVSSTGPSSLSASSARAIEQRFDTPPWPQLSAATHATLKGNVTKFDANVAAIEMLRHLESESAQPTDEQRDVLNKYTGWGGIKQPFDKWPVAEWRDRADQLKSFLSESEFESARESTLNAHFTPVPIIDSVWSALRQLGFNGGRIVEPAAGTGYFLGAMPSDIAQNSSVTAVELDDLSARFLKKLYGEKATILAGGFEAQILPDEYYDLIIGNVPFGKYQVACHRRKVYSNWSIHNYFIGRALDLVRPGGLVAVITSSFFMDGDNAKIREVVARKAKLVGAFRLPVGTFADIASTDVVADLVILQRRAAGEFMTPAERASWVLTEPFKAADGTPLTPHGLSRGSAYWQNNPDRVIGSLTVRRAQYGVTVVPELTGADVGDVLAQRVATLPQGVYQAASDDRREVQLQANVDVSLKAGSYYVKNGDIYRFDGVGSSLQKMNGKRAARVTGLVSIRDTLQRLVAEQAKFDADESLLNSLRYEMNVRYDAFVASYGCISARANRLAMGKDVTWPLLLSLEFYDEDEDKAVKADIFHKRTVIPHAVPTKAETPADALAITMAELGRIDTEYLGRLLGRDGTEVLLDLSSIGAVYLDPQTMRYEEASAYLSGNVREKLAVAKSAGVAFAQNAKALENALPADLLPTQIDVVPGAPWIPAKDYEDFLKGLVAAEWSHCSWATVDVSREAVTGTWSVQPTGPDATLMSTTWGTSAKNGFELFQLLMNQVDAEVFDKIDDRQVLNPVQTASARLKQEDLKAEFRRWLWSDDDRAKRLARVYNDTYNVYVPRKFDGSRLRLPGYSNALKLRPHQLNAIMRIISGNNTLLAHVVGAGKTVTMVAGSQELVRLGIANKPMHVVPNHMLLQYASEFLRAYPGASVLVASKEDFDRQNRRAFIARCATGNWDAIILTHSMFERISPDQAASQDYIEGILEELKLAQQTTRDRAASRAINRTIKDWTARLEKMQALWKKDDLMTFGETGCDFLMTDEAHLFKNLFRLSSMKRIAGLGDANSQRAFDMLLKTRQIMGLRGNREMGIVFATGTPISNTLGEMHVLQRYLQPVSLAKAGLENFDSWAAQYGRAVNSMEVSPDGSSFRMNRRFKTFVNVPELMGLFRQVADIQTKKMLNLPTPPLLTGAHQICVSEPSPELKEYIKGLVKRAEDIQARLVRPDQDNMLAVTGDGRRAALDLRMVMPGAAFDENGKIGKCVHNVARIWELTKSFKGTQVIFSDLGTPTGKSFNVYQELRDRLIARGIPAAEIAFIHDAPTDHAKASLFARARAGSIRILIGSTQKMGVGTNVQTLLYAAHHLDAPWRPSDLEQRDGRIERQGNTCEFIEIWRYVSAGSFDAYMWQTLAAKAQFIEQVMSGDAESRTVEDAMMSALSYDEVKAIACGNPAVREKAMIDAEILSLGLKEKQWRESVWNAKNQLWNLPARVKEARQLAVDYGRFAEDLAVVEQRLELVVSGNAYSDVSQIEEIITLSIDALIAMKPSKDVLLRDRLIGNIAGANLSYRLSFDSFVIELQRPDLGLTAEIGSYRTGRAVLKKLPEVLANVRASAEKFERRVSYLGGQEPVLKSVINSEFKDGERLKELRTRSHEIALELGLLKDMAGTEGVGAAANIASAAAAGLVEMAEGSDNEDEPETVEDALAE